MTLTTIASGVGSPQLPVYVTVSTGKYSDMADNVQVVTLKGNTKTDPVFSPWVPMHGARIFYERYAANRWSTIQDDNTVTFMATGPWRVQVELPPD